MGREIRSSLPDDRKRCGQLRLPDDHNRTAPPQTRLRHAGQCCARWLFMRSSRSPAASGSERIEASLEAGPANIASRARIV